MLLLAPAIGVRLTPVMVLEVIGALALMALALTAFGVLVASRRKRMESFQIVMQFLMMPMLFLSGPLFPLQRLPAWLSAITKVNPVTYAVDPVRRIVMQAQDLPAMVIARFGAGVELFRRVLPIGLELLVTTVFALVFLVLAIGGFARTE